MRYIPRLFPSGDARLAPARNCLAVLLMTNRHYHEAEPLLTEALASYEKQGDGNARALGITLNNFGLLRQFQKRKRRCSWYSSRESIGGFGGLTQAPTTRYGGYAHWATLAAVRAESGHRDEACIAFRTALAVAESRLGYQHPLYGSVLLNYAAFLRRIGRKTEGKALESRAKAILAG